MTEKYTPSEELTMLAVGQYRKSAAIPLLFKTLSPKTWICPGEKEELFYHIGLGINARRNMSQHLEKSFYDSIDIVSLRNVALGKDSTLVTLVDGEYFDFPILTELRESLSILGRLRREVIGELKREFTDYVIENNGFSLDYGEFQLRENSIYFKDNRKIPDEPDRSNSARVVGGIEI